MKFSCIHTTNSLYLCHQSIYKQPKRTENAYKHKTSKMKNKSKTVVSVNFCGYKFQREFTAHGNVLKSLQNLSTLHNQLPSFDMDSDKLIVSFSSN